MANISHKRVVHVNVSTSSTSTCHDVADVDMATTTRRRWHVVVSKKTTRLANTTDKTTTLSAEIALKYNDFNIKRVRKTPCGREERLKRCVLCKKREKWMPKWQHVARTRCARRCFYIVNVDVMTSATMWWRRRRRCRRHRVKKDNTSCKHYCQNDVSVCRNRVKWHILLVLFSFQFIHSSSYFIRIWAQSNSDYIVVFDSALSQDDKRDNHYDMVKRIFSNWWGQRGGV